MKSGGDPGEGFEATVQVGSAPTTPASLADTLRGTPPDMPDKIGRYAIRRILGRGGMGVVYCGYDAELDREVAIKLVRAEVAGGSEGPTRLKREARIMAQLSHPNLVTVHEVGEHDGQVYVAMELIKGATVRKWLRKQERSWREIIDVYLEAARGLAAAHKVGVIHRDFKPDNVIVADDGRVRVLDFGLARPVGALPTTAPPARDTDASVSLTMTGAVMGTPAYMPPEQHEGKLTDARADQFSFCVSLFEALYGGRPFVGSSMMELAKATTSGEIAERPANTKVPRKIHDTILCGLARDPDARFPSMDVMVARLEAKLRSRGNVYAFTGAGLAVAAVIVGLLVMRPSGAPAPVDETCKPIAPKLAEVWDEAAQRRLEQRLRATNKPYAGDIWRALVRDVDGYVSAWTAAQTEICSNADQRDRLLRAQQLTCLDDHLLRLRGYLRGTAEVDPAALALGFEGMDEATARECTNAAAVRARAPAPPGELADAVLRQRERVYAAQAHIATHAHVPWATLTPHLLIMRDAAEKLDKLGHGPAHAEALYYLGRALGYVDKTAQAGKVLERALELAEASRADAIAARILTQQVYQQAFSTAGGTKLQTLIKRAEIALTRAGKPSMVEGRLLHTRAHHASLGGDYERAVTLAKQAHTAFSRALPPDSYRLALVESDLARFASYQQQWDVHHAQLSIAIDAFERFSGSRHPRLAELLARLAKTQSGVDPPRSADLGLGPALRALRLLRPAAAQSSALIGRAFGEVARALIAHGRYREAAEAYRAAVRVLERVHPRGDYLRIDNLRNLSELAWAFELDMVEAEGAAARAIELAKARKGSDVSAAVATLAEIRLAQGRYVEAHALAEPLLGASGTTSARRRGAALLARIQAAQGQAARAGDYLKLMPETNAAEVDAKRVARAHVALALGRNAEAITMLKATLDTTTLAPHVAATLRGYLAVALARAGQHKTAAAELQAAVDRDPGKGHPLAIMARFELAQLLWRNARDREKARDHAQTARDSARKFAPRNKRRNRKLDRWLRGH